MNTKIPKRPGTSAAVPTQKVVTTWVELEDEVEKLQEFYFQAQDCLDDIRHAIAARSEDELKKCLARWGDLKARDSFTVDPSLFGRSRMAN